MKLTERYDLEKMKNRTEEMVFEAIEKEIDNGGDTCSREECVLSARMSRGQEEGG
jgi:hypothetical protein